LGGKAVLSENDFDDIVAGFYRAACGSTGWVDALVPFQRAMSAVVIVLFAVDPFLGCVAFSYEASDLPAEASLDYIRTYHRIDPNAQLVMALAPGEWRHCWEHFDDSYVASDRFYQEFLIPYGSRYASGCKLLQEGSLSILLGVHRGPGSRPLDSAEMAACGRLARHLTDAVVLERARVNVRNQGRLGMELLARLRAPLVLVDEQRRLHHANPAAQAILAKGGAVTERGGRLHCYRSQDDSALVVGLRQLLCEDRTRSGVTHADKVFLKARATNQHATLGLYMYALLPKETLYAFGDQPLAMLLFHEPGWRVALDPFVVAAAFDLTPGEARVAVATAHGASPEQIARQHAVSINTVRFQLRSIFGKTGTARQAELVSLLAGLPMAALGIGDA